MGVTHCTNEESAEVGETVKNRFIFIIPALQRRGKRNQSFQSIDKMGVCAHGVMARWVAMEFSKPVGKKKLNK